MISKIRISPKVTYEVVYSTDLGPGVLGECRFDTKQIVVNLNQEKDELIKTLIHECTHAITHVYKIEISHKAVYKLEKAILNLWRLNKLLR